MTTNLYKDLEEAVATFLGGLVELPRTVVVDTTNWPPMAKKILNDLPRYEITMDYDRFTSGGIGEMRNVTHDDQVKLLGVGK